MQTEFPLYRKYSNNKSWFKVLSPDAFEELQVFGRYYDIHRIEAKTMPERNYINDLIANEGGRWEMIDESEYQERMQYCRDNLQPMSGVKH